MTIYLRDQSVDLGKTEVSLLERLKFVHFCSYRISRADRIPVEEFDFFYELFCDIIFKIIFKVRQYLRC